MPLSNDSPFINPICDECEEVLEKFDPVFPHPKNADEVICWGCYETMGGPFSDRKN